MTSAAITHYPSTHLSSSLPPSHLLPSELGPHFLGRGFNVDTDLWTRRSSYSGGRNEQRRSCGRSVGQEELKEQVERFLKVVPA